MTAQEAIKWVRVIMTTQNQSIHKASYDDRTISLLMAISALEKQIPKKMKHLTECANEGYYCPTCSKKLFKKEVINKHKCCYNCGQRINYNECDEY